MRINKKRYEVADTFWKRAKGLMFRKSTRPMLFVFDNDDYHSIWMLFMRFPIDIVFLDSKMNVINEVKNAKPIGFSPKTWRIYRPKKKCRYIIERMAGT